MTFNYDCEQKYSSKSEIEEKNYNKNTSILIYTNKQGTKEFYVVSAYYFANIAESWGYKICTTLMRALFAE